LRNAIRRADPSDATIAGAPALRTAHPEWFVRAVQRDWPEHWAAILDANNARPPLTVRVNVRRSDRDRYLDTLSAAGIIAHPTSYARDGIRIERAVPAEALPEFATGGVSIQDEAAQLSASVLQIPGTAHVLDACAAPGGKSCHIVEAHAPTVTLLALDRSASRLDKIKESMTRLGLSATLAVADAAAVATWWDGVPFDRILVDVPCSGSGVIRRHPDIKIHRRPEDIDGLVAQQSRLLDALWPLLTVGGKLVYATCSIFKAENDHVIARFVSATNDAEVDQIEAEWGIRSKWGRQIITGEAQMDGFYYARLTRTSAPSAALTKVKERLF
jgi:16S rRNA (cytosine967-C5)-methyltransferase